MLIRVNSCMYFALLSNVWRPNSFISLFEGETNEEVVEKLAQEEPELTPNNVVSILVSASFLKMGPLVDYALMYLHQNMNKVLVTTHNLNCLGEPLLTR
jgi:hypothetical protein